MSYLKDTTETKQSHPTSHKDFYALLLLIKVLVVDVGLVVPA